MLLTTLRAAVLGLLASCLCVSPQAVATTSLPAVFAGAYKVFTSSTDFRQGTAAGTTTSSDRLRISTPVGTRSVGGHTYQYSTWTSPWVTRTHPFTRLVPSWAATTPTGTWVQVLVQVRTGSGTTSSLKSLGSWASGDSVIRRSSAGSQSDAVAHVATDTVVAGAKPLAAFRLTVRLLRRAGDPSPTVAEVGAVTSRPGTLPATSKPLSTKPVSLGVPSYSQMVHQGENPEYGGGGEAWCSPTSLAMVLGYYDRLPSPSTYTWVSSSYPQRWVNAVARLTYDHAYDGTGNWPFNTAYAATRVSNAFVTRLADLRMAERFIRAGIPLIVSIQFSDGGLRGAPISATNGHLVVLRGFSASGNPVVNDPAARTAGTVRRTYNRAQFERAWLGGSAGMAYVLQPASRPLPTRPAGVYAW
ncbi:MAG: peptidase C39 family protein [Marmoricola sp.]